MKSAEETARHLQEIIASIYLRPTMYGENTAGVEQALGIYHAIWAYVTERTDDHFRALADIGEVAGCGTMDFKSAYRKLYPAASEKQVLEFTLKHWGAVTEQVGIPLPAKSPDPARSSSPGGT